MSFFNCMTVAQKIAFFTEEKAKNTPLRVIAKNFGLHRSSVSYICKRSTGLNYSEIDRQKAIKETDKGRK